MAAEIIATYTGGGTLWNPGVEVQPGDAVIWFLRLDTSADAPSARMTALADSGGTPITFSHVAHTDWGAYDSTHYVATNWGNTVFNSEGDVTTDQTIYAIFDQFTGFTAGNHYVKFTLPGSSGERVEAAHLLRGVMPDDPGTYIYYSEPSSSYEKVYGSSGSVVLDHFPASVPLTGSSSIVYCLWRMNFGIGPPAGYTSVPGTKILEYTTYDPSDAPAFTSSMIAYVGGLTGVGTTIADPVEGGWSGSLLGTGYLMDVIVINGGETVAPIGPTIYHVDVIVFNGSATKPPTEF